MQVEQESVYHLHIPKAAGSSFRIDARAIVEDSGRAFRSKEECFYNAVGDEHVISMVRSPQSHVVSMFRYCIYNRNFLNHGLEGFINQQIGLHPNLGGPVTEWEQDPEAMGSILEEWLRAWVDMVDAGTANGYLPQSGVRPEGTFPNCYAPLNVQTQRLTCEDRDVHPEEVNTQLAIENLNSLWFIGIVEEYETSVCLLHARARGELPLGCACDSRDLLQTTGSNSNDHTARPVISDEAQALLDRLTTQDQVLYEAAVARFHEDVAAVEAEFGVTILCPDDDDDGN